MPLETLFDALGDAAEGFIAITDDLGKQMAAARHRAHQEKEKQRANILQHAQHAGLQDAAWKGNRVQAQMFGATVEWRESSYKNKNSPRQYVSHATWRFQPPLPASFSFRRPGFFDQLNALFGGTSVPQVQLLWSDNAITHYMRTPQIDESAAAMARDNLRTEAGNLLLSRHGRLKKHAAQLAAAQPLADALAARWRSRSTTLEALGFRASNELGRWSGAIDGVAIDIHETRRRSSYTTFIRATLRKPLPHGTLISRQQKRHRKTKGAQPLGDLMIDTMLSVVSTDPAEVSRRVCHDAARAPLLEVVHGHPRSRVDRDQIVLRLSGPIVGDCGAPLVAELHNALHNAP